MRKFLNYQIIVILLIGLCFVNMVPAQSNKNLFDGIKNEKVLSMLKHLPRQYGGMNVPTVDGRLLYDLIVKNKYQRGLEIGTSNGYSGLWLGAAFQETGGKLITIEIERKRAIEARENFHKAGFDEVISSRINDAFKEIPDIKGDFDFVFIDAWKPDYIKFFHLLKNRIKIGGVITAHNVINAGRDMQDFLNAIKNDPSFETTIDKSSFAGVSISFKKKVKQEIKKK